MLATVTKASSESESGKRGMGGGACEAGGENEETARVGGARGMGGGACETAGETAGVGRARGMGGCACEAGGENEEIAGAQRVGVAIRPILLECL